MNIGERVRIYKDHTWYSQGKIIEIDEDYVVVDFIDWIQKFSRSELILKIFFYEDIWVATGGEITTDFR